VSQPPGFISAEDSALRVRVFERELSLNASLLSPDMQINATVSPAGSSGAVNVTLTSLEPQKLVLAPNERTAGTAVISVPIGAARSRLSRRNSSFIRRMLR
jgi:hypothetical protein